MPVVERGEMERAARRKGMERAMSKTEKAPEKNGTAGAGPEQDVETLANALRLEREKNELLLNEVVALEDELVNGQLAEFGAVISEQTRDFWREQLLSNREAARGALAELARLRDEGQAQSQDAAAVSAGSGQARRPLHNRYTARPLPRQGYAGQAAAQEPGAENTAVRIRNRAHELCKAERIPFSAAFRRAEGEVSECRGVGVSE